MATSHRMYTFYSTNCRMYTFYNLPIECIHSTNLPKNIYILWLSTFYTTYVYRWIVLVSTSMCWECSTTGAYLICTETKLLMSLRTEQAVQLSFGWPCLVSLQIIYISVHENPKGWFAGSMHLVECSTRWELVQYNEYPNYLCIFIALQLCFGLAPYSEAITKIWFE